MEVLFEEPHGAKDGFQQSSNQVYDDFSTKNLREPPLTRPKYNQEMSGLNLRQPSEDSVHIAIKCGRQELYKFDVELTVSQA